MWKGKGIEMLDDKEVFTLFKAPTIMGISHYFPSIISAFKEHKCRPELQYSKASKTVSGPKIRKDPLSESAAPK